jgi:hypothetical protein
MVPFSAEARPGRYGNGSDYGRSTIITIGDRMVLGWMIARPASSDHPNASEAEHLSLGRTADRTHWGVRFAVGVVQNDRRQPFVTAAVARVWLHSWEKICVVPGGELSPSDMPTYAFSRSSNTSVAMRAAVIDAGQPE